jgi:hypothetical protein
MRRPNDPDFSVVLGGPLYRFYLRTRLARPPLELVWRRILSISLLCWLPPLVLSVFGGRLLNRVSMPFLYDAEVHSKLLVAVPLLIGAEVIAHWQISDVTGQFLDRGIIAPEDRGRFERLIVSAERLQSSVVVEAVLAVCVLIGGYRLWSHNVALGVSSWYCANINGQTHLSPAGCWYAFVSLPVLRFLLLRWYFRLFIWYRFLWCVRALPLHLNLFHPDRAGGLAFLSGSAYAFVPVLAAQTVMVSGMIFSRIWYTGATLPAFKMEIVGVTLFLLIVLLIPLTFFAVKLTLARQTARMEFGALASRYVDEFRRKWTEENRAQPEPLLGDPDLQSLADLGNSYAAVSEMRIVPIDRGDVLRLGAVILAPLAPLALTLIPLGGVLDKVLRLVF